MLHANRLRKLCMMFSYRFQLTVTSATIEYMFLPHIKQLTHITAWLAFTCAQLAQQSIPKQSWLYHKYKYLSLAFSLQNE